MANNGQTPNKTPNQGGSRKPQNQINRRFNAIYLLYAGLLLFLTVVWVMRTPEAPVKSRWTDIEQMIADNDIDRIEVINSERAEVYLREGRVEKYRQLEEYKNIPEKGHQFWFNIGTFSALREDVKAAEAKYGVKVPVDPEPRRNGWLDVLSFLPWLFIIGLMIWMMRSMARNAGGGAQGGQGGIFNVGKAKPQMSDKNESKVTFKDVAGLEEAKVEIMEIVDFLRNPQKYRELGGKIPKGALLVGPPGTGKTLLAKAVAGEANVPFFSMSGSDFVEMFVGVGASRVRDLFRQAKEKAPCIVFIDEIDAVGRARGKNAGFSGNDERENTLNQLLTEMDGFGTNSGVILLAATNRADILDKALMRAGRFDRQIEVGLPDIKEREDIFNVHLRGLKLDPNLDRAFLARQTPGFSGADIANVCNEAALIAARNNKKFVEREDFLNAIDRIVGGLERKNTIMTPEEKRITAYHEAGHATVSWMLEYTNPLIKVTIIPRGRSLGATWFLPDERHTMSREHMMHALAMGLGGRVAEQLEFGILDTGALSDLEGVTKRAYAMVAYYGMSDKVGNRSYYDSSQTDMGFTKPYSEETAKLIDDEVKAIIDEAYVLAEKVLKENWDGFLQLSHMLLDKEVVFAEDLEKIFGKSVADLKKGEREALEVKPQEPQEPQEERPHAGVEIAPDADAETPAEVFSEPVGKPFADDSGNAGTDE